MRNTTVLIHLDIFRKNLQELKRELKNITLCLALKADAYGHGALECARTAMQEGITIFGLASAKEALALRAEGIQARLITYSLPYVEEFEDLIENDIEFFWASEADLDLLIQTAQKTRKKARLHIKIDTGMGRIGCRPENYITLLEKILQNSQNLMLCGTCTHFPLSDVEDGKAYTLEQNKIFKACIDSAKQKGLTTGVVHSANSAASLRFPETHYDMVRPGIVAYGYPGCNYDSPNTPDAPYKPVMELRSRICFIKEVKPGTPISYGHRWKSSESRWIATIRSGYGDGLPRRASGKFGVHSLKGEFWPQVGTICMDQCMLDLGPSRNSAGALIACPAQVWDEVILFGPQSFANTARTLADAAETIPYEISCGINARIPRIYC